MSPTPPVAEWLTRTTPRSLRRGPLDLRTFIANPRVRTFYDRPCVARAPGLAALERVRPWKGSDRRFAAVNHRRLSATPLVATRAAAKGERQDPLPEGLGSTGAFLGMENRIRQTTPSRGGTCARGQGTSSVHGLGAARAGRRGLGIAVAAGASHHPPVLVCPLLILVRLGSRSTFRLYESSS